MTATTGFSTILAPLLGGAPVQRDALRAAFTEVLEGRASSAEVGAFLGGLAGRARSSDAVEFVAACRAMQPQVDFRRPGQLTVNLVGTGGGRSTFNISTASAFVLAAIGVRVVKTGSGAFSSRSGFAETASALQVLKPLPFETLQQISDAVGIVLVHPSAYPAPLRGLAETIRPASFRQLGGFVNTIGPLLSPVIVDLPVMGASSPGLFQLLRHSVAALGDPDALIISGEGALDEVSPLGVTQLGRSSTGQLWTFDAASVQLAPVEWDGLAGVEPLKSAGLLRRLLGGQGTAAQRDTVALNVAIVLHAIGHSPSVDAGLMVARDALDRGLAAEKLGLLQAALRSC